MTTAFEKWLNNVGHKQSYLFSWQVQQNIGHLAILTLIALALNLKPDLNYSCHHCYVAEWTNMFKNSAVNSDSTLIAK